ncbi:hypothetical protein JCM30566_16880 [Marinitoga arctica]
MDKRKIRRLIFLIVFISSLYINSISPLMTTFQDNFNISISQSSLLPFMNTIGNIIFATLSGFLISKIGLKNSLFYAFYSLLLSIIVFLFSSNYIGLVIAMFFVGGGLGQIFSVTVSMYDHLDENLQNYGLFHAFFGLGGIVGPFLVSIFLKYTISYKYLFGIYLVLFIILITIIISKNLIENIKYEAFSIIESISLIKKRLVLITILMLTIYAGSEIGSITWSANLFRDYFGYSKEGSALFISSFWFFFTFGRIITDTLYKYLKERTSLYIPLFSSIILFIIILFKIPYLYVLYGFLLGPIFPATQKFLNSSLSHREVGLISGIIFAGTGVGSMFITTTMGIVADKNIFISYMFPVIFLFIISLLSNLRLKNPNINRLSKKSKMK